MARNQKDQYYWKAKSEGYRSRASYKLQQINSKFNVIKEHDNVIDLGAAPGGWLQVAKEISDGTIVGVDLKRIKPIDGVETIKGDITKDFTINKILAILEDEKADVVICDAAPNLSGNWSLDHARSIGLSESAFECAKKVLKPGGTFVFKVFQGDMFKNFLDDIKKEFVHVKAYNPKASRTQSAEIYIIAKKFLVTPVKVGNIYQAEIEGIGKGNDGFTHIDGFIVFIQNGKKGDKVQIKITDVKQNFAFAKIEEYLK